jgi:hypothetical protein
VDGDLLFNHLLLPKGPLEDRNESNSRPPDHQELRPWDEEDLRRLGIYDPHSGHSNDNNETIMML